MLHGSPEPREVTTHAKLAAWSIVRFGLGVEGSCGREYAVGWGSKRQAPALRLSAHYNVPESRCNAPLWLVMLGLGWAGLCVVGKKDDRGEARREGDLLSDTKAHRCINVCLLAMR